MLTLRCFLVRSYVLRDTAKDVPRDKAIEKLTPCKRQESLTVAFLMIQQPIWVVSINNLPGGPSSKDSLPAVLFAYCFFSNPKSLGDVEPPAALSRTDRSTKRRFDHFSFKLYSERSCFPVEQVPFYLFSEFIWLIRHLNNTNPFYLVSKVHSGPYYFIVLA